MTGVEIAAGAALAAAASSAVTAVGTATQAKGQAKARQAAADYNRKVALRDKKIADQNRILAIRNAETAAEDTRRSYRRQLSTIKTVYGSSGAELTGTALDVLEDSAFESELEISRTEYSGRVEARKSALQMLSLDDKANLAQIESDAAASAASSAMGLGYLKAFSSMARGVSGAASAYSKLDTGTDTASTTSTNNNYGEY